MNKKFLSVVLALLLLIFGLTLCSCEEQANYSPTVEFSVSPLNDSMQLILNQETQPIKIDSNIFIATLGDNLIIKNVIVAPNVKLLKIGKTQNVKTLKPNSVRDNIYSFNLR